MRHLVLGIKILGYIIIIVSIVGLGLFVRELITEKFKLDCITYGELSSNPVYYYNNICYVEINKNTWIDKNNLNLLVTELPK